MIPPRLRMKLERMFVHTNKKGDRFVGGKLTTNETCTNLLELKSLAGGGYIKYEDNKEFRRVFGVRGWDVELTDKGRAELEEKEAP